MSHTASNDRDRAHGCYVALRHVEGPQGEELFVSVRPPAELDLPHQVTCAWRAIQEVLAGRGGDYTHVITETVFLRDRFEIGRLRRVRDELLGEGVASAARPARTEIEQPPLVGDAAFEVLVHAAIPGDASIERESISPETGCDCSDCSLLHGLRIRQGEETRIHTGALYGAGKHAYEQTHAMFAAAEKMLHDGGMAFSDVMRTWIYFPEMERDYAEFNRARREFFQSRDVHPVPASTGIGAGTVANAHDVCLSVYAVKRGDCPVERVVMTTPTLNEAPEYGSDFSRGMRVEEANKVALFVSGTASLDESGATVHVGDLRGQARRMLLNVEALLKAQGASLGDVVSAITYLKHPGEAERFLELLREAGYGSFPHAIVAAEVCRPELLCETELLAVLPRATVARG